MRQPLGKKKKNEKPFFKKNQKKVKVTSKNQSNSHKWKWKDMNNCKKKKLENCGVVSEKKNEILSSENEKEVWRERAHLYSSM